MGDVKLAYRNTPVESAIEPVCNEATKGPGAKGQSLDEIGDRWANTLLFSPLAIFLAFAIAGRACETTQSREYKSTFTSCADSNHDGRLTVEEVRSTYPSLNNYLAEFSEETEILLNEASNRGTMQAPKPYISYNPPAYSNITLNAGSEDLKKLLKEANCEPEDAEQRLVKRD